MPKRSLNTSNASGGAAAASKKRRESAAASQNKNVQLAGIINKVELKNFMNHAYLTFDFQPRVNFVTGRNGTGKSALLTGLMVGLGGKAAATNRGSQLSGFIQHGKNVSDIKVTLNNEGIDAYHPEIYGDVISVERKLTRMKDNACTSDYKIRTSTGKLISSRKSDLTRILDHFNIQVENPVAILNQETSKSFLCSKQPSDVYKFFVKATLLEHMEQNYDKAKVEFDKSMDTLKSKESALPTMEYELKKAEDRAEALKSLDKLRTKLQDKQCGLAWAVVAQKEAEHEKLVAKAQGLQKKRPKIEDKLRKAKEDVVAANEKKTEIEERIQAMASDTGKFEPERLQLKTEHNQRKQATRTKIDAAKQVQKDLRRVEGEKKLMQDRVTEIQANSQDDRSAQLRERDEKIERLTKKFRDIEQNHANTKAQMNQATQSLSSLTEKRNEHASNIGELERIKKQRQQKIAELEKVRNNKTARFGRNIPALQEEIEKLVKAGRFKRRPYGPLGAHITMKDMSYVLGAERALGGVMSAFLVDNLADKDLLEATKKRLYTPGERPPAVIHCKYSDRRHDIQRDRAQTNHPTLSDLINIDNDHVFNCIVDEVSPQNMVMVLDPTQARQLMVRSPPAKTYVVSIEK